MPSLHAQHEPTLEAEYADDAAATIVPERLDPWTAGGFKSAQHAKAKLLWQQKED